MNRIYYQGSFKLATNWPEEPKELKHGRPQGWASDYTEPPKGAPLWDIIKEQYTQAITSAMENGIAFADQEGVKYQVWQVINGNPKSWQPKDGDNWLAPEEAEIVWDNPCSEKCQETEVFIGTINEGTYLCEDGCVWSKRIAVLKSEKKTSVRKKSFVKSESVEKKERWVVFLNHLRKLDSDNIGILTAEFYDALGNELSKPELQSIADRLNQATPKE